jgi:hypothetical protein
MRFRLQPGPKPRVVEGEAAGLDLWRGPLAAATADIGQSQPLKLVHLLPPHVRVELLIQTILTRDWDDEAWPMVREEFKKAMALRSRLRRAGWWN